MFLFTFHFSIVQSFGEALEVKPLVDREGPVEKLFENGQITISTAYPNPSTHFIFFDYKLSDGVQEAKITISDIFGTTLSAHRLVPQSTHLKVSVGKIPSGVYFYTLTLEKKAVITKKLIVRH